MILIFTTLVYWMSPHSGTDRYVSLQLQKPVTLGTHSEIQSSMPMSSALVGYPQHRMWFFNSVLTVVGTHSLFV